MSLRTDGIFEPRFYTLPCRVGESIWLRPFGDVHRDAPHHAAHEWQSWLKRVTGDSRPAWYFGMGDYCDFMRAHTRALVAHAEIEAENVQDRLNEGGKRTVEELAEELRPLRKRIIGLLGGNHWLELVFRKKGETTRVHSDKHLANLLGVEYLGTQSHLVLTLDDGKAGKKAEVKLIIHHGAGGGGTIGGGLNRVIRMLNGWHASIGLMGDNHQRGIVPVGSQLDSRLVAGRAVVVDSVRFVGRTGSFYCGYEPGLPSYVVDKAFEPSNIGTIEIELALRKHPRTGLHYVAIGGYQPA